MEILGRVSLDGPMDRRPGTPQLELIKAQLAASIDLISNADGRF